ncbi:MAG: hypothetical protein GY757_19895, partial [bacterium]|nr:hypothetical protein [bacterium]
IIIQGKLEKNTLQRALKDAFIAAQDKEGEKILARKTTMIKKLDDLCVTSFKKNQYLLLLDEFDQNLEGAANGTPGPLQREAKELLNVLLPGLDNNDQMTRLIITSRYEFTLMAQNEDQVNERLTAIRINGFRELEQGKKSRGLKNIIDRKDKNGKEDKKLIAKLIAAGHGNPLLMEQVDAVAGEMIGKEEEQLWTAIQNTKETFIRQHHLRELLQQGGDPLMQFLCSISVFRKPVLERGVELAAKEAGLEKWQKLLRRGIALSLIEFDQAHRSYQVTPLLQEDLLQEKKEQKGQTKTHEAALKYYSEICATRDPLEPEQAIELTYHSLASGQEEEAAHQGALLVEHYQEYLDHDKSRRLGEWILAAKKKDCTT